MLTLQKYAWTVSFSRTLKRAKIQTKVFGTIFNKKIQIQFHGNSYLDFQSFPVEDHFAKALGDTWVKLQKAEEEKRSNTNAKKSESETKKPTLPIVASSWIHFTYKRANDSSYSYKTFLKPISSSQIYFPISQIKSFLKNHKIHQKKSIKNRWSLHSSYLRFFIAFFECVSCQTKS